MKPLSLVAISAILCGGCGGALGIENHLKSQNGPVAYLYDSEKIAVKQTGTVRIGSVVVEDLLPPATKVTEQSVFVLPLLVVNVWKFDYQSQLGQASITNDYKAFIKDSFIEELKRSGRYTYVDDQSDMEIDVTIKHLSMTAPVRKSGNFIFALYAFAYSQGYYAGPAQVLITADAVLKKDGREIFKQEIGGIGRSGMLQGPRLRIGDFTTAMIEALSLSVKNLNENIVREVNIRADAAMQDVTACVGC